MAVDDQKSVWGFLVVAVVVVMSAPVLQVAYSQAETQTLVQDEVHSVSLNNTTSDSFSVVQSGSSYSDSATVVQGNETLTPGYDYQWYANNGTVTVFNTSDTVSGATEVSYYYFERTQATNAVWSFISAILGLQGIYVLAAAARAVQAYIQDFFGGAPEGLRQ
jgi:hypothetical protein